MIVARRVLSPVPLNATVDAGVSLVGLVFAVLTAMLRGLLQRGLAAALRSQRSAHRGEWGQVAVTHR